MLLLCFFGVRFVILASTAIFQLLFTISCSGMLSFAFACFDLVTYSCCLASISCGFLKHVFCCLCFFWLSCVRGFSHLFCYLLLLVVPVLFRLLSLVCLLALLRWFASFVGGQ